MALVQDRTSQLMSYQDRAHEHQELPVPFVQSLLVALELEKAMGSCYRQWYLNSYNRSLIAQWSMGAIFHEMAQKNLVNGNYHAMLRNKLLLRFADDDLSEPLKKYLDEHSDIARQLYQTDRMVFLMALLNHENPIPLLYDNAVFLINRIDIMDEGIQDLESDAFRMAFEKFIVN